jgi:hypothetical protein
MRNVSDKKCGENQNTRFMFNNFVGNPTVGQATGDSIIRLMRIACWITKATDTNSEHVILISLPLHQWLRERASTYTVRLGNKVFIMLLSPRLQYKYVFGVQMRIAV